MKGQFYIIGALLLIMLFFVGLPRPNQLTTEAFNDLPYFASNLKAEYPRAMSLGLNQSDYMNTMMNFTNFANRVLEERSINYEALWIATENVSGTTLNVSEGGILSTNTTISLNASGTTATLMLASNATNSTTISNPGAEFNFSFSFLGENESVTWPRDKANLFVFINLTRSGSSAITNVTACPFFITAILANCAKRVN